MVRIGKGEMEKRVSLSSFHNYYENAGWLILDHVVGSSFEQVDESDEISDSEWDEAIDEEPEKPLSEMNREELTAKAESLGIDISGLTKNAQIREKIKSCM